MKLSSSAFLNNEFIPSTYTCDGANFNPPLEFADVPQNAKSLVLIVDDPDAPVGVWAHWTVWNIDPSARFVPENSSPPGAIEGITSFGKQGYGGPCPPDGRHRYFFKLYALDTALNLSPSTDKAALEAAITGRIIEQAELVGIYER